MRSARSSARASSTSDRSSRDVPHDRSAYAVAAPAPPHPICTTRSNDASGSPAMSPSRYPIQSVLYPMRRPPSNTTRLTAPRCSASGSSSSTMSRTSCLQGCVMFIAAKPRRFASARRAPTSSGGPAELDEVEDAVLVVEAERRGLRLMHRRGEGRRDALADEPDEVAAAGARAAEVCSSGVTRRP